MRDLIVIGRTSRSGRSSLWSVRGLDVLVMESSDQAAKPGRSKIETILVFLREYQGRTWLAAHTRKRRSRRPDVDCEER